MSAEPSIIPLSYTVPDSSSYTGRYLPRNILVDNPEDQGSRWSTAIQSNSNHWILLQLNKLAVLKQITFGKHHKPHPCTMKEFKVFAGMDSEHMAEVLHASLKNDPNKEHFSVRHFNSIGIYFPTRYIKIVPLSAHGQNYNSSIWHVSMSGIEDEAFVGRIKKNYDEFRETQLLRHVLKHLRQRRMLTPYSSILSRSGLQIEHPLVSKLHENIVLQGNWEQAMDLLNSISSASLFDSYLHRCQPYAVWKRIHDTNTNGDVPPLRAGHAMCIDHVNGLIYLFGGWDGVKSLDDFWVFDIKRSRWSIISQVTSREHNAPGARSCHKMVHDPKLGYIYVLGRLGDEEPKAGQEISSGRSGTDTNTTPTLSLKPISEFYRYHIETRKWTCLSYDVASSNGPPLIFDHQMVMDSEAQMLYVFGGRVVDGNSDSVKYSGLYSYNVQNNKWRLLQHPDNVSHASVNIPPRFGHSMVLEPNSRQLFIFAGQLNDKFLSDMYSYDIATDTTTEIFSNFTSAGGPGACFTQRAVIDPRLHEIYVFCGLTRGHQNGGGTYLASGPSNWVYRYSSQPGQWTRMLSEADVDSSKGTEEEDDSVEPVPRYAHQVVYDPNTRTVYMHGGNAGFAGALERHQYENDRDDAEGEQETLRREGDGSTEKEKRLGDFWKMSLVRPSRDEILRQAKYQIRQQQFREMCEEKPAVEALSFLRNEVSSVVDHSNPKEAETFRSLLTHLVMASPIDSLPTPDDEAPPRKRSRPNTPEKDSSSVPVSTNGVGVASLNGTNGTVNRSTIGTATKSSPRPGINFGVDKEKLQSSEDPVEYESDPNPSFTAVVSGSNNVSIGGGDDLGPIGDHSSSSDRHHHKPLTQKRFEQRNEVFESLLEFVAEEAKQPDRNLLDFIDWFGL
ncbi:hypothetical protein K435DRAFT_966971 [Dendrothele bispora CBS 962.96]|uniref:F5/8 type C domain-containing protein n=1 Tax=Dendrothele bispora (strain CBS 962.96) TaxID=1314807 RepID=A0A4S8LX14_DENBC|nr:hypothetical protein K435DRAFT_966971 [Dendrothele bispora CBS 962.96]